MANKEVSRVTSGRRVRVMVRFFHKYNNNMRRAGRSHGGFDVMWWSPWAGFIFLPQKCLGLRRGEG